MCFYSFNTICKDNVPNLKRNHRSEYIHSQALKDTTINVVYYISLWLVSQTSSTWFELNKRISWNFTKIVFQIRVTVVYPYAQKIVYCDKVTVGWVIMPTVWCRFYNYNILKLFNRVRQKEKFILAKLASDFDFILAKQILYSPYWRVTWFCTRQLQLCIYNTKVAFKNCLVSFATGFI